MKKQFLLLFLTLSSLYILRGQPISISVLVAPPIASNVSDYLDQNVLKITNSSNTSISIYLKGFLTSDNGISASTKAGYKPRLPIVVPANQSLILQATTSNGNNYMDQKNIDYTTGNYKLEDIARTGVIPEGNYTLCVVAYEYTTGELKSLESGFGACRAFSIVIPPPPFVDCNMNVPSLNGQEDLFVGRTSLISQSDAATIRFNWSPTSARGVLVIYDLCLLQLLPGQPNTADVLLDAIRNKSINLIKIPIHVTTVNVAISLYPKLVPGRYLWAVVARDVANDKTQFQNNGISNVCEFEWKPISLRKLQNFTQIELPASATPIYPVSSGGTLQVNANQPSGLYIPFSKFPFIVDLLGNLSNYDFAESTLKVGLDAACTNPILSSKKTTTTFKKNTNDLVFIDPNSPPANPTDNRLTFNEQPNLLRGQTYFWLADIGLGKNPNIMQTSLSTGSSFTFGMPPATLTLPENTLVSKTNQISFSWTFNAASGLFPPKVAAQTQAPTVGNIAIDNPPTGLNIDQLNVQMQAQATVFKSNNTVALVSVNGNIYERWQLQVARDADFKSIVATETGLLEDSGLGSKSDGLIKSLVFNNKGVMLPIAENGTFYWRMRWAVDPTKTDFAQTYSTSVVRSFKIDNPNNKTDFTAPYLGTPIKLADGIKINGDMKTQNYTGDIIYPYDGSKIPQIEGGTFIIPRLNETDRAMYKQKGCVFPDSVPEYQKDEELATLANAANYLRTFYTPTDNSYTNYKHDCSRIEEPAKRRIREIEAKATISNIDPRYNECGQLRAWMIALYNMDKVCNSGTKSGTGNVADPVTTTGLTTGIGVGIMAKPILGKAGTVYPYDGSKLNAVPATIVIPTVSEADHALYKKWACESAAWTEDKIDARYAQLIADILKNFYALPTQEEKCAAAQEWYNIINSMKTAEEGDCGRYRLYQILLYNLDFDYVTTCVKTYSSTILGGFITPYLGGLGLDIAKKLDVKVNGGGGLKTLGASSDIIYPTNGSKLSGIPSGNFAVPRMSLDDVFQSKGCKQTDELASWAVDPIVNLLRNWNASSTADKCTEIAKRKQNIEDAKAKAAWGELDCAAYMNDRIMLNNMDASICGKPIDLIDIKMSSEKVVNLDMDNVVVKKDPVAPIIPIRPNATKQIVKSAALCVTPVATVTKVDATNGGSNGSISIGVDNPALYTFKWSLNGVAFAKTGYNLTGLAAGAYTVTVARVNNVNCSTVVKVTILNNGGNTLKNNINTVAIIPTKGELAGEGCGNISEEAKKSGTEYGKAWIKEQSDRHLQNGVVVIDDSGCQALKLWVEGDLNNCRNSLKTSIASIESTAAYSREAKDSRIQQVCESTCPCIISNLICTSSLTCR
jgi:hypothetical protein